MENKETFQARLKPFFSPSDQMDIQLAYILSKFAHRAQTRKETVNGQPVRYFEHVRRVAIILMDQLKIMDKDMIIAAQNHDLLEDCAPDITPQLLEHLFGKEVVSMVILLSKIPKEGYHERLANCHDWRVIALKMCDRLDNLRSLMCDGTTVEFQRKQIKETQEIYYPIFDNLLKICPGHYLNNIMLVRDEIRSLIERYKTILELQAQAPNLTGAHLPNP